MSDFIFTVEDLFSRNEGGCLAQHECSYFRIPAYQRGFKWGSGDDQPFHKMLVDFHAAWKDEKPEYLLQAIAVKKAKPPGDDQDQALDVIDGQQRLTSLSILFWILRSESDKDLTDPSNKKLKYAIRHGHGILSEHLDSLAGETEQPPEAQAQQDDYYMHAALNRCREFVQKEIGDPAKEKMVDPAKKAEFHRFVRERVKILVNAVEAHLPAETVFGNLNSNRVPLKDTELVKGVVLARSAREVATSNSGPLLALQERLIRGRRWDEIAGWIQRPEVGSFFFGNEKDPLHSLLALVATTLGKPETKSKDDLFPFFNEQKDYSKVFSTLVETTLSLREWYSDTLLYNLMGYVLYHEGSLESRIKSLAQWLTILSHKELKRVLMSKRSEILKECLTENTPDESTEKKMGYFENEHKRNSHRALLAISVFDGEATEKTYRKFNFPAFITEKWSLEHIFPQNPFGKGQKLSEEQKSEAWRIFFGEGGPATRLDTVSEKSWKDIQAKKELPEKELEEEVQKILQRDPSINGIGNLCLLSGSDNSALGCLMFDGKRRSIRERIKAGSFVPSHTYAVFSKMIGGGENGTLDTWTSKDIEAHEASVGKRLRELTLNPKEAEIQ